MVNRMDDFREFIKEHKPDLSISRVPKDVLEKFKSIAEEEFANDYGMFLKKLLDDHLELKEFKKMFFNGEYIIKRKE